VAVNSWKTLPETDACALGLPSGTTFTGNPADGFLLSRNGCGRGVGGGSADTVHNGDSHKGIHFPNAFTPNHDGTNDWWKPVVGGVLTEFQLLVYNRWGGAETGKGYGTFDPMRLDEQKRVSSGHPFL
jgi:hypothetical protein